MDKKISQLSSATTPLTGAEELAIVQSGVTKKTTIEDIKGYKVYTALLTQSGGDGPSPVNWDENLIKGVTYEIVSLAVGDDVTQYGAPNNNIGTKFVCNQDVNVWGSSGSELAYNTGAPVVTVLENTIGNIWFEYSSAGEYLLKTNGNLTLSTTIANKEIFGYNQTTGVSTSFWFLNIFDEGESDYRIISTVKVNTTNNTSTSENGLLNNTPIEIRVYN